MVDDVGNRCFSFTTNIFFSILTFTLKSELKKTNVTLTATAFVSTESGSINPIHLSEDFSKHFH